MKNLILILSTATLVGIAFGWFLLQLLCEVAWGLLGFAALAFVLTPKSEYMHDIY